MYNNTRTHNQPAPAPNPEKKGESAAINKLTENEDENAGDTCGCDSARGHGLTQAGESTEGHRLEQSDEQGTNLRQQHFDDKKGENAYENTSRNPAGQSQNQPGQEMNEIEDETTAPHRKGNAAASPQKNAKGPSVEAVTEDDDANTR